MSYNILVKTFKPYLMKKLIFMIVVLLSLVSYSQVHFPERDHFQIMATLDPYASYKEKGTCLGADIEYIFNPLYIKGSMTLFPQLKGGYTEYGGAVGLNVFLDRWEEVRTYGGVKLGSIYRGGNPYPTVGLEAGIDFTLGEHLTLGIGVSNDYRTDWTFWGGEAGWRKSGEGRIGYRW